ncbi:unnamed protein product [Amoebophrya sp. A25]|nr:unnamed protein product [Amoebophrya sp. A25]|eukprot:GSA25T00004320001.1
MAPVLENDEANKGACGEKRLRTADRALCRRVPNDVTLGSEPCELLRVLHRGFRDQLSLVEQAESSQAQSSAQPPHDGGGADHVVDAGSRSNGEGAEAVMMQEDERSITLTAGLRLTNNADEEDVGMSTEEPTLQSMLDRFQNTSRNNGTSASSNFVRSTSLRKADIVLAGKWETISLSTEPPFELRVGSSGGAPNSGAPSTTSSSSAAVVPLPPTAEANTKSDAGATKGPTTSSTASSTETDAEQGEGPRPQRVGEREISQSDLQNFDYRVRLDSIPIFSYKAAKHGQMVRYRGLIFNVVGEREIYPAFSLVAAEAVTPSEELRCERIAHVYKYTDDAPLHTDPTLPDPPVFWDRSVAEAIQVPYESSWVEAGMPQPSLKRRRDEEGSSEEMAVENASTIEAEQQTLTADSSEACNIVNEAARRQQKVALVFEGDLEVERESGAKIHDVVDVVAITSLVHPEAPRLHVVKVVQRNQPLPMDYVSRHFSSCSAYELPQLREHTLSHLRSTLPVSMSGDSLVMEYLMMALCAKKYCFQEDAILGLTPLNFLGRSSTEVAQTSRALREIHPYIFALDASLEGLRGAAFRGHKDPDTEVMTPGQLELASGSVLLVDETELTCGELKDESVMNAAVLTAVLQTQKVPISFGFYELEYACEVQGIVFGGKGSSVYLPDGRVMAVPDASFKGSDAMKFANAKLDEEQDSKTRSCKDDKSAPKSTTTTTTTTEVYLGNEKVTTASSSVSASVAKTTTGDHQLLQSGEENVRHLARFYLHRVQELQTKAIAGDSDQFALSTDVNDEIANAYSITREQCREAFADRASSVFSQDMIYAWFDFFRSWCLSRGVLRPDVEQWKAFARLEEERIARVKGWVQSKGSAR